MEHLEKSGLGCFVGRQCYNSFLYADDLIIISISVIDLQKLVDICHNTFNEIGLTINLSKSHCIRIGARHSHPCRDILISGKPILWKMETKFLGVTLRKGKSFICDWQDSKSRFYKASNAIFSNLGSNPPIEVTLGLVRAQCIPILTYGMCATTVSSTDINKLSFAYNSIFYKLFKSSSKHVIECCQYFCNYWPLINLLDFNRYCFLKKLLLNGVLCPESLLDKKDYSDLLIISDKYCLRITDSINCIKYKIWQFIFNALSI